MLPGVLDELAAHRPLQIDAGAIGDLEQVEQDVRHFVRDPLLRHRVRTRRLRLLGRHPLEDLGQFRCFHHQGHRQVLRRVEGLPCAFRCELAQRGLQRFQVQGRPLPMFRRQASPFGVHH
jgi:hypothetical protein